MGGVEGAGDGWREWVAPGGLKHEKYKAEIKDRKVLEILQTKDYKIQELEQRVTGQQQEMNTFSQRRTATVDEESSLMKKELTALREQLVNNTQELKAESSILIRSLSLKRTHGPLYQQEPSSLDTARPTAANIWLVGSVIRHQ
ncbi:hypothetical protein NQZ68_006137 [Dissostichus eleginoides]|nr:hypothetical protein NQZ68_006137 [Dissostichus eleginoides]